MNWGPLSPINLRRASAALWDAAAFFLATLALAGARYDFDLDLVQWEAALYYPVIASALMILVGYSVGLYRGHFRVGSFQEAFRLAFTVATITLFLAVMFVFFVPVFPRGLALSVPPGALLLMVAGRWLVRAYYDRAPASTAEEDGPVLVYGAGVIGGQIARAIRGSAESEMRVVGFLDDDPGNRNLHLEGSRVVGRGADLEAVAARLGAAKVILAITRADEEFIRALTLRTDAVGLKLMVIPPVELRSCMLVRASARRFNPAGSALLHLVKDCEIGEYRGIQWN